MDSKGQAIILENVAESGSDNAPADMSDLTDVEIANLKQLRGVKTNDLQLRLDKHGLPLVPQPSTYKDDPLNWSPSWKLFIALQISWLAFLGNFAAAVPNPAFVNISKSFKITVVQASYELTVYIIFAGIGPFFITPVANVYGRRPVYLAGNLLAGLCNVIAGFTNSWSGLLVTRVFCGIGSGAAASIGAATICDLYFMHERGLYMGIFTLFLTNGAHLAPLVGGYVAKDLGWKQCFSIPGYIQLATLLLNLVSLPETLYSRKNQLEHQEHSYMDLLLFKASRLTDRRMTLADFVRPFYLLKYATIVIPAFYYMTSFAYGTVLFATTGSRIFTSLYHFNVAQTGLMLSIPLTIGCLIGEGSAGWVTDYMVFRYAKRHGGHRKPEPRLNALVLALLLPLGVIIDGVCLQRNKTIHWIGPAFGMGIACFGLQVATTVVYSYCTDCFKPQSAEVSVILNAFRQIFSALVSFYALPFAEEVSYQSAWITFAMLNVVTLIPMLALRVYGSRWRGYPSQAPPKFHNDI